MRARRHRGVAARLAAALCLAALTASCHMGADKEHSDIAGIVPQADDGTATPTAEARYTKWPDPDTLLIYIDGSRYKVSADGSVFSPEGAPCFDICNEGRLERLYFAQKGSSLFLFYTDATADGTASFARRIDIESGETLWSSDVTGVAMCRPVIKGQFAYIGSFGFVGKMKLKSGQYDWKYSNLNRDGRFEQFRDIKFPNSHEVQFVSHHPLAFGSDTVVVNDISGEIVKMK